MAGIRCLHCPARWHKPRDCWYLGKWCCPRMDLHGYRRGKYAVRNRVVCSVVETAGCDCLTEISCRIHGAYPNILTTAEVKAAQPEFVRASIVGQPMRKVSFKQFKSNERVSCPVAVTLNLPMQTALA